MKTKVQNAVLSTLLISVLISCRAENKATDYNIVTGPSAIVSEDSNLHNNVCSLRPDFDLTKEEQVLSCEQQQNCQAVYNSDSTIYIGCTEKSATETQPPVEEPKAEEPKAEEPKAEEPKAEDPKTEDPKAEEPKTEDPKNEDPKNDYDKPEEPKTDEPNVYNKPEEPKTDEPNVYNKPEGPKNRYDQPSESDESEDSQFDYCDENNKKIYICHKNNGAKKMKTLCISVNGWLHGHQKNHSGHKEEDRLGKCSVDDLQE